jgi:hypothetical protein
MEAAIRSTYDVARHGERVVVIVDREEEENVVVVEDETVLEGFFDRLMFWKQDQMVFEAEDEE